MVTNKNQQPEINNPQSFWYTQHLTFASAPTASNSGMALVHSGHCRRAYSGQRGAKRHPLGKRAESGGAPGMAASGPADFAKVGRAAMSARV
jgi:hypothetical protein